MPTLPPKHHLLCRPVVVECVECQAECAGEISACMDERDFFTESRTTRAIELVCTFCRSKESYELPWVVRKKKGSLPRQADERDRAKFAKSQSYMVLAQDKVSCKRCRKPFDVSGTKTLAFLND